jgi:hypothetical protein
MSLGCRSSPREVRRASEAFSDRLRREEVQGQGGRGERQRERGEESRGSTEARAEEGCREDGSCSARRRSCRGRQRGKGRGGHEGESR